MKKHHRGMRVDFAAPPEDYRAGQQKTLREASPGVFLVRAETTGFSKNSILAEDLAFLGI